MHPEDIKAALRKRGVTIRTIAARLGVHDATVSNIIWARGKSRRIADGIAQVLGTTADDLWPNTYRPERDTTKGERRAA